MEICKPTTIKELSEITTMRYIRALIIDQSNKLNVYSPQSKALNKLYKWVSENIPDERLHDEIKESD